jgi:hypothetical protein
MISRNLNKRSSDEIDKWIHPESLLQNRPIVQINIKVEMSSVSTRYEDWQDIRIIEPTTDKAEIRDIS